MLCVLFICVCIRTKEKQSINKRHVKKLDTLTVSRWFGTRSSVRARFTCHLFLLYICVVSCRRRIRIRRTNQRDICTRCILNVISARSELNSQCRTLLLITHISYYMHLYACQVHSRVYVFTRRLITISWCLPVKMLLY